MKKFNNIVLKRLFNKVLAFKFTKQLLLNGAYAYISFIHIPLFVKSYIALMLSSIRKKLRSFLFFLTYRLNFARKLVVFLGQSYSLKQLKHRGQYFIGILYRLLIIRQLARLKRIIRVETEPAKKKDLMHRIVANGYHYEAILMFYDRLRGSLGWVMGFKALWFLVRKYLSSFFNISFNRIKRNMPLSKLKVTDWNINPSIGLKFSKAYLYLDTANMSKKRLSILKRYPLDPYYAAKFVPVAPMTEAFYTRDEFMAIYPEVDDDKFHDEPETFTNGFDIFEWDHLGEEDVMYEIHWIWRPNFYEWMEWQGYPAARRDWFEDIDRLSVDAVRRRATVRGTQRRYLRRRLLSLFKTVLIFYKLDRGFDKYIFVGKLFLEEEDYTWWEKFRDSIRVRTIVSRWVPAYEYLGFNAFERVHDHATSLNRLQRNRFEYNIEQQEDFFSLKVLPSTGWVEMLCVMLFGMFCWLIVFQLGMVDGLYGRVDGLSYAEYAYDYFIPKKSHIFFHYVKTSPIIDFQSGWFYLHDRHLFYKKNFDISMYNTHIAYSIFGERQWYTPDTLQHPLYNRSYNLINTKTRNWATWKADSPIYVSLWAQQKYWNNSSPLLVHRTIDYWFSGLPFWFTLIANPIWLDWQRDARTQANYVPSNAPESVEELLNLPSAFIRTWKMAKPRLWYEPNNTIHYINEEVLLRDHYALIYKLHDANFIRVQLPSMSIWAEWCAGVAKTFESTYVNMFNFFSSTIPYYLSIPIVGVLFLFVVSLTAFHLLKAKWFGLSRKLNSGDAYTYFSLSNFPVFDAVRFIYYQSDFEAANPIFRFLYTVELLKNPKFARFMLYRHLLYRENGRLAQYFGHFIYPVSEDFLALKVQFSSFSDESYVTSFDESQRARFWRLWYVGTIENERLSDYNYLPFFEQFSECDIDQDDPEEDGGDSTRGLPDYSLRDLEYEMVPFYYTRYYQTYRNKRFLSLCTKNRRYRISREIVKNDLLYTRLPSFVEDVQFYVSNKNVNELSASTVFHIQRLFGDIANRYAEIIFKGWKQEEKWDNPRRFRRKRKLYRPFYRYMLRGYKHQNHLFAYQSVNWFLFDFTETLLPHMYLGESSEDIGIYYFNSDYYSRAIGRVEALAAQSSIAWYGVNSAFGFYTVDRPSRGPKLTTDIREIEIWNFYLSFYEHDHDSMLSPIALDGNKWMHDNPAVEMVLFEEQMKLATSEVTAHAEEYDADLELDEPLPDDEESEHTMFFYSPLGLKLGGISYYPAERSLKEMRERGFILSVEEYYWAYNQRKTWIDILECDDDIAPLAAFPNVDLGSYLLNGFFSSRYWNYDMYAEEDGPVYPKIGTTDFALSEKEGFPHPHYHFPYRSYATLSGSWPQALGRGTYDGMALFVIGETRVLHDTFDKEEVLALRLPAWQGEYLATHPSLRFIFRTWEQNYAVYDDADDFERYHWMMDTHLWMTYPLGYAWDSPI